MSNLYRTLRVFAILGGLTSIPVLAGDGPTFNLGGALINQLDSAKAITNNSLGFSLSGSVDWAMGNDYVVRTGLGFNLLPGSAWNAAGTSFNGVKTSLTGVQLFGDLHIPTRHKGLNLVAGLSVQQWRYSTTKPAASVSPIGADSSSGNINGPKIGMRLGLDWRLNSKWSAEFMVQQVELGNKDSSDARGNSEVTPFLTNENPGWLQVGVRYHF